MINQRIPNDRGDEEIVNEIDFVIMDEIANSEGEENILEEIENTLSLIEETEGQLNQFANANPVGPTQSQSVGEHGLRDNDSLILGSSISGESLDGDISEGEMEGERRNYDSGRLPNDVELISEDEENEEGNIYRNSEVNNVEPISDGEIEEDDRNFDTGRVSASDGVLLEQETEDREENNADNESMSNGSIIYDAERIANEIVMGEPEPEGRGDAMSISDSESENDVFIDNQCYDSNGEVQFRKIKQEVFSASQSETGQDNISSKCETGQDNASSKSETETNTPQRRAESNSYSGRSSASTICSETNFSSRSSSMHSSRRGSESSHSSQMDESGPEDDSADDEESISYYMEKVKEKYLPKTKVQLIASPDGTEKGYRHEVVWPADAIQVPLIPIQVPAKVYKFVLDPFQHAAVVCIDNYQSLLISAHTSAGKTVAAEYAIAKALKDNQRVIYTTPIKALSNQKYREFSQEFTDVGIITGDVSINTSASCLVMTTEILRQMLYQGSEITREVGWVIFDEIHYMKDKGRGVIWEETIIMLPQKAHFVFLSATIPNATQFAEWIATLHKQPCNVIHTNYRPIPLCHYIYPNGGEQVVQFVRVNAETGNVEFNDDGFKAAMEFLEGQNAPSEDESEEESNVVRLVTKLISEKMTPIIVFSFSRKECESYALDLSSLDFNNDEEKGLISEVFLNAVDILSPVDQSLPQVLTLLPLLKRGIGIHHSGLLPIMKETIEILFSEGLIKILFATETFAMGLNMPAHTVVFTSVKKFDGKIKRLITPGEYIQMSGRAGRRSYDKYGTSIVMMHDVISNQEARNMIFGQPDPIDSSFRLTYNMMLNLIRGHDKTPEYMMSKSFLEFQHRSLAPAICDRIIKANEECAKYNAIPRMEEIASYYMLRRELALQTKEMNSIITKPENIMPFVQSGRLAYITSDGKSFGWGVIINHSKDKATKHYAIKVLLWVSSDGAHSKTTADVKPFQKGQESPVAIILPVTCNTIAKLSQVRLNCPSDLLSENSRIALLQIMDSAISNFQDEPPLLDPVKDMRITDQNLLNLINRIKMNENKLLAHSLYKSEELPQLYGLFHKKMKAYDEFCIEQEDLKKYNDLLNSEELKKRKRVLRKLGYLSPDELIELKGRIACELTGCDELLLTELMFSGIFVALDPPECIALLSCLICTEKSANANPPCDELKKSYEVLQRIAEHIAKVSQDCNLDIDPELYVSGFKPTLMNVVYQWCKGSTFAALFELTDIYEGTIIRCMTALNEILNQMTQAAKVMGNKELETKFTTGIKLIKRDIVFAASLYL